MGLVWPSPTHVQPTPSRRPPTQRSFLLLWVPIDFFHVGRRRLQRWRIGGRWQHHLAMRRRPKIVAFAVRRRTTVPPWLRHG